MPAPVAGSPTDALAPLADAVMQAARDEPAGDRDVARAFSLGWQMAELFHPPSPRLPEADARLHALGALAPDERLAILRGQIHSGLGRLAPAIAGAKLAVPELGDLTDVRQAHVAVLGTLTATDFRLGKAYELGRAMADGCRLPAGAEELRRELDAQRVAPMLGWLDELSSALPAHAGHSVAASLQRWRDHVAGPGAMDANLLLAFRRQGELWRALLSGEKRGTEVLDTGNYLDALRGLADRTWHVVLGVVERFRLLVAVAAALLVGGVVLLIVSGSGAAVTGGAVSLLAGLGLTWKGIGGTVGRLLTRAEQPLWGAELDGVIAEAITLLPGNAKDHRDRHGVALAMPRPDLSRPPVP